MKKDILLTSFLSLNNVLQLVFIKSVVFIYSFNSSPCFWFNRTRDLTNSNETIKEKIGEFISWKHCCCKRAPQIHNSCAEIKLETNVIDVGEQKRVHFSSAQEVIIIPARSTKERIWRPLLQRIQYALRNCIQYVCCPCNAIIQLITNAKSSEPGENSSNQGSSRTETRGINAKI